MRRILALLAVLVLPTVSVAQTPGVYTSGSPQTPDLSGKWCGYWVSDKNGHTGPLNAKFKQKDCDSYRVTFSGRFAKVIPFRYTTTMNVVGTGDGAMVLTAEKRLGLGSFRTTAVATATNFDANFTGGRDNGRFVLRR